LPGKDDFIDYYQVNDDLFFKDSSSQVDRDNDPYRFFKQAASQIDRPISSIKHFCKHPTDPETFATITVASKFFRNKDIQLKEFMCLFDYKRLTRLRLKNYIFILRIFTQIDPSLYPEVKDRLYKIEKVCEYLDLIKEGSNIWKIYNRLDLDGQIHDLEVPVQGEEEYEKPKEDEKKVIHEDQEYSRFFAKSYLSQSRKRFQGEDFSNTLLNEEEKWTLRAKWIEEVLAKFRKNNETKDWSPWIEAKVESLNDLDVIVNKTEVIEDK
jgi:hypothetical protein